MARSLMEKSVKFGASAPNFTSVFSSFQAVSRLVHGRSLMEKSVKFGAAAPNFTSMFSSFSGGEPISCPIECLEAEGRLEVGGLGGAAPQPRCGIALGLITLVYVICHAF